MKKNAMKYLRSIFRLFLQLLIRLDSNFIKLLELEIKRTQGVGWGAATTEVEVRTVLSHLNLALGETLTILDVGANIGNYTDACLSILPFASIVAFEPSKYARSILINRFEKDERVTIVPLALGKVNGEATLWSDEKGSPLASLSHRDLVYLGINFEHEEKILITTLDTWNESKNIEPLWIKLDVEGSELEVLQGATKILKFARVIQFEFGGCNIDTRTFFRDYWEFFTSKNFKVFRICPTGSFEIKRYSEDEEYFTTTNYVAVRNPG